MDHRQKLPWTLPLALVAGLVAFCVWVAAGGFDLGRVMDQIGLAALAAVPLFLFLRLVHSLWQDLAGAR